MNIFTISNKRRKHRKKINMHLVTNETIHHFQNNYKSNTATTSDATPIIIDNVPSSFPTQIVTKSSDNTNDNNLEITENIIRDNSVNKKGISNDNTNFSKKSFLENIIEMIGKPNHNFSKTFNTPDVQKHREIKEQKQKLEMIKREEARQKKIENDRRRKEIEEQERRIQEQEKRRQEQEQQRILESKQMKENIIDVVGKEILIHSHSNLDVIIGDTIMISNIMNKLMMNNNNITLLTHYKCSDVFICNLKRDNYKIIEIDENKIISYIDNNHSNYDTIFIRNHNILNMLENKEFLYKTIFYGLDIHLDSISKLNNKFNYIITQSNELKNKYIQKGIISSKIYVLEPITFKYEFDIPKRNDNEPIIPIIDKCNFLSKKIYLIIWDDKNNAKGINIDCEILYNTLTELHYNVSYLRIPILYLEQFDVLNNKILLDGDIYIFSEVCFADIYDFIFKHNKEIVCIPNIDSYSTYKPRIKDRESDFINSLKHYSKNNNFNIWCKTKQIYNWLKKENVSNLNYTHFCYNIYSSIKGNLSNKVIQILKKNNNYILLDTGNSTTQRKYLEEILDIFIENENIPYTLLVKTTPTVYDKFLNNSKYKKNNNIEIISEMLPVDDLTYIYQQCKFFIYCSRFDGYGLALSQAIRYNLFIFTFDGLPWCELLESYPRKCFVNCKQDFTKSMGVNIKGKALSQIYYKGDFDDLTNKLLYNKEKYEDIINTTEELCDFVNIYNHDVFLSNINYYFQTKYNICTIYNTTSLGVVSYKNREHIFIENLMNIICQVKDIVIYLNTSTEFIKKLLSNISNVHVTLCDTDLKSLTKLKVINYLNNDVNLIIDDDIIYPPDYVKYTYNILKNLDKKCFYSYNGYTDKFKYPFTTKTQLCLQDNCNLGSGTLFYNKNTVTDNKLEQFLEKVLHESVDVNVQLFCDKILKQFCQENKIKTKIISPKHTYWMVNNEKMKYGLLELKKELDIYDLKNVQTIPIKDKLIDIHNNLPNKVLRFFVNQIDIINTKDNYFDYYQIYVKHNIVYINDNVNNIFNINLNDESLFKKLKIVVTEISKIYNHNLKIRVTGNN